MKACNYKDFVVKYGDWVEVFDNSGSLITSFKATIDMCPDMLTRYLVFKAGMDPEIQYKIKRRGK